MRRDRRELGPHDDLDDLPLDDLRERAGPCDFHLLAARHDLV